MWWIRHNSILSHILCLFAFLCVACDASANDDANVKGDSIAENKGVGPVTGLALPRFAALKCQETNMRTGPAYHYPIKFTYQYQYYPVEVIAEFENWRLINAQDGTQGWIHHSLFTRARYAIIKDNKFITKKLRYSVPQNQAILLRLPEEDSYPILRLEVGVIVKIKQCMPDWCQLMVLDKIGWIRKINIWGVYDHEVFKK